ncbi:DUF551 domain-containing protein [Escherichia coli]|uniref:DUF551 domain-containing protein n=1 Tax=Escherichia coli TaxID=562 RepID=UPI000C1BEC84|nr:DUF551 domain-containing protein [Escherichia coli]EFJ8066640.1 DUF551 domain-containing protein [Escherichia coli]EFM6027414.1 DUF551 domain-containing protein [Escherichia coli]
MKFSKFSELVNRILSNNHSHRRDMDVTIVVHSPGSIGSTPSVEVQSIHAGFDWDSGKVLIFPSQPLTTLTPEQITDITDSVRKGQSWHAYQEYKKHQEQLEKLSIELDAAKQRIAELEGNRTALAVENELARKAVQAFCDVVGDNTEVIVTINKYASQLAAEPIAPNDVREQTAIPQVPVTPDGWISCSERMPPQDDWILIYSKHGEYMAGQVQGEYVELSDGTLSWLGNVLFWMPLPEPPKGAK